MPVSPLVNEDKQIIDLLCGWSTRVPATAAVMANDMASYHWAGYGSLIGCSEAAG